MEIPIQHELSRWKEKLSKCKRLVLIVMLSSCSSELLMVFICAGNAYER